MSDHGDLMAGSIAYVAEWTHGFDLTDEQFDKLFPGATESMSVTEMFQRPHTAAIALWCFDNGITARLWPLNRHTKARITFATEAHAFAFKMRWL